MRLEDFFSDYSQQLAPTRKAMLRGELAPALSLLPKQRAGHNAYTLSLLEQARLAFVSEQWSVSEALFATAYQEIEQDKAKAKIQLSKGVDNISAAMSNDSALKYQVPPYEQSMMHSYQALNYVFQHKLEAALVEVRRANLVQEQALQNHQHELDEAQSQMRAQGLNNQSLDNAYASMKQTIAQVKNGFQNAYTFYLSGLLYEASGAVNDAYIDYKKALEIFPNNPYLQQDVSRLARALNMDDDSVELVQSTKGDGLALGADQGELVVLYEQDLISAKQGTHVNLPVSSRHGDLRFFSFSLPVYHHSNAVIQPLTLQLPQQSFQSSAIVTLQSLAMKTLEQQLPAMVTRQVVRLLAKEQVRRKMKQEGGDIGNILASLYNLASEHADTRNWQTLPQNIQLLRVKLPKGQHQLKFSHKNGTSMVDVAINSGRISLVNFTTFGSFTDFHIKNL